MKNKYLERVDSFNLNANTKSILKRGPALPTAASALSPT